MTRSSIEASPLSSNESSDSGSKPVQGSQPELYPVALAACDLCNRKRIRCSRQLPACSQCRKSGAPCTRDRESIRPSKRPYKGMDRFHQGLLQFEQPKANPPQGSLILTKKVMFRGKLKEGARGEVGADAEKGEGDNDYELDRAAPVRQPMGNRSLIFPNDWTKAMCKLFYSRSTRCQFSMFLDMVGIPISTKHREDRLFLQSILSSQPKPQPSPTSTPFANGDATSLAMGVFIMRDQLARAALLDLATDAYFYYFNPFVPLFTKSAYLTTPRSRLLRAAVQRIGLQYLNPSPLRTQLMTELTRELYALTQPSVIRKSLSTLQASVAIISGLFASELMDLRKATFRMSSTMVYCLGAHLVRGGENLERRLVFQAMNQTDRALFESYSLSIVRVTGFEANPRACHGQPPEGICLFVTSRCRFLVDLIFKRLHTELLQWSNASATHLPGFIRAAEAKLLDITQWGIGQLIPLLKTASASCFLVRQSLFILLYRYHYDRIQLINKLLHIHPTDFRISPTPLKPDRITSSSLRGIHSSFQLIHLSSLLSHGPFHIRLSNRVMAAARFLIANYPPPHHRYRAPIDYGLQLALRILDSIDHHKQLRPKSDLDSDHKLLSLLLLRSNIHLEA